MIDEPVVRRRASQAFPSLLSGVGAGLIVCLLAGCDDERGLSVKAVTAAVQPPSSVAKNCGATGIAVQVLGSGGPEITYNDRASSGYLVWVDGVARVMIDAGAGTAANFGRSGARVEDLDAILLSHLHVDHSADLPALVKASFFGSRRNNLPVFGPTGNQVMPGTSEYIQALFGTNGAYRYLSGFADAEIVSAYNLVVDDVTATGRAVVRALSNDVLDVQAIPVTHGPLPALAWRVDIGEHSVTFSGDMSGARETLPELALDTDLLIAHNAIPQTAKGGVTKLHMRPSTIGKIASQAKVGRLVLSHRMRRALGQEAQTTAAIGEHYTGAVGFAEDMDCLVLSR